MTKRQYTYQFIPTKDPQTGTLEILDEDHSTSCASFALEIENFQGETCPFGLKHGVYATGGQKGFRLDEKGKDARRKAHDKKEKGQEDRSKNEVDKDYNPDNY